MSNARTDESVISAAMINQRRMLIVGRCLLKQLVPLVPSISVDDNKIKELNKYKGRVLNNRLTLKKKIKIKKEKKTMDRRDDR